MMLCTNDVTLCVSPAMLCYACAGGVDTAADAEAWRSAGGESYCENQEFTNLLSARWREVLNKPGVCVR